MKKCVNLKISPEGRFIVKKDGAPFFWLADTAWELFHRLNKEEAVEYLATRAAQRFNVIQAVALAEFDGLAVPNAYGRTPLLKNSGEFDPTLPDVGGEYDYWSHVDYIVDTACKLGLYIGLLPTWGDKFNIMWGAGPAIFTPENAHTYGKWIGERYKERDNIIWIMGGDRAIENETHSAIVRNMAQGIKESTCGKHLMTYHPTGGNSSSEYGIHGESWLDFNMIQSGHGRAYTKNYEYVQKDYALAPVKPTLDGEPRYEDHAIGFDAANGYFDEHEVRVAAYWAVLSGALGHTYGHHSIWSFATSVSDYYTDKVGYFPVKWRDALHRPGGEQMKYVAELFNSRNFLELAPCQELLCENYTGSNYMSAAKGKNYAYIYAPNGLDIKVNMAVLGGKSATANWYNPRNGAYKFAGIYRNESVANFAPPSCGRNNDWVLVLDISDII